MKSLTPLLSVVVCLLPAMMVSAQDPRQSAGLSVRRTPALPAVEELLDNYVAAIGGREALSKLTSRHVTGRLRIEGLNLTGDLEAFYARPDKFSSVVNVTRVGRFVEVSNGGRAWASDPVTGLREMTGPELASSIRDSTLNRELILRTFYASLVVVGREKIGEATAYVVEATPKNGGDPEKLYFDVDSHLLIRHDIDRDTPQGKILVETWLSDFRVVDGVRLPHRVRQVSPVFITSFSYTRIRHNIPIDDARFTKPASP